MIYLDNNATTQPDQDMLNEALSVVFQTYGNPSSPHLAGLESKDIIEEARSKVAQAIGAKSSEIIFTSGGTEANSLALNNADGRWSNVFASSVEHSSIYYQIKNSNNLIKVLSDGLLDCDHLEHLLQKSNNSETCLISVMLANNETGVITDPFGNLFKLKEKYGFTLHVDAVQGFGKLAINVSNAPIDMLSISAHKCHGLKGVGALYVQRDCHLPLKLFSGGSHEFGVRPGTENQVGIYSLGYIADKITNNVQYQQEVHSLAKKRDFFEEKLSDITHQVNGNVLYRTVNTSNIYFPEINNLDIFIETLSSNGVCASGRSACASGILAPSRVLEAMFGKDAWRTLGSVRFSLSVNNTYEELSEAVSIIRESLEEHKEM